MTKETWEQRRDRRLQDHYAEGVIKTTKNLYHEAYAQGRTDLLEDVKELVEAAKNLKWSGNGMGSYCVSDAEAAEMMKALESWRKKTGGGS